jgi:hypothetical protein
MREKVHRGLLLAQPRRHLFSSTLRYAFAMGRVISGTSGLPPTSSLPTVAVAGPTVQRVLIPGPIGPRGAPGPTTIPLFSGLGQQNVATYLRAGGASLDMAGFPTISGLSRTVLFTCDYSVSSSLDTGAVQLWDATNGVLISGTLDTTSQVAAKRFVSPPLIVGSSPGNIRSDAPIEYDVQISLQVGGLTERVLILNACLLITYA